MSLREFISYNRWQKGFSLLFALLIWFTVRQGVERDSIALGDPDGYSRTFEHLPIRLLTQASEVNRFRVIPAEVTVVLTGTPDILNRLRPQDVQVYVNIADDSDDSPRHRAVQVNAPGAQLGAVSPQEVLIERADPAPIPAAE